MCLGVPGRILSITQPSGGILQDPIATVDFQGSRVDVSLSLVPEGKVGDWALVHAGFALTLLDEEEAAETWRWLDKAEVVRELPKTPNPEVTP